MGDQRSGFVARAVGWLRAGYPEGVPKQDYVALLGLLRRKLTEDEVRTIAAEVAAQDGIISSADIEETIRATVLQDASPEDTVRVAAHLAAGGWPLADPPAD